MLEDAQGNRKRRSRWTIVVWVVAIAGLGALLPFVVSQASRGPVTTTAILALHGSSALEPDLRTQALLLVHGDDFLEAVLEQPRVRSTDWYKELSPSTDRRGALRSRLSVRLIPQTSLLEVSLSGSRHAAEDLPRVLNELLDLYVSPACPQIGVGPWPSTGHAR